jgi:hypothetical protein
MSFTSTYNSLSVNGYRLTSANIFTINATIPQSNTANIAVSCAISGDGKYIATGKISGSNGGLLTWVNNNGILTQQANLSSNNSTAQLGEIAKQIDINYTGDGVIEGAPFTDFLANADVGVVRGATRANATWSFSSAFKANGFANLNQFGDSVAIANSSAIAIGTNTANKLYISDIGNSSQTIFNAPYSFTTFAQAVDINGNADIVAASYRRYESSNIAIGAVQLYNYANLTWTAGSLITANDIVANGSEFGTSVKFNTTGNILIVSAPGTTVNSYSNVGAIYVFKFASNTWNQVAKLTPNDINYSQIDSLNGLGTKNIGLSDDGNIIVGVFSGTYSNNDLKSRIYIFTNNGDNTYVQTQTISNVANTQYLDIGISDNGQYLVTIGVDPFPNYVLQLYTLT